MTDRHAGYHVILTHDIREDDAEAIFTAIRMIKGVLSVTPKIASFEQAVASGRRDAAWCEALRALASKGPDQG